MRCARDAHGHAIVLDLHSMPPLMPGPMGDAAPALVLGDRFGRSASARLMTLAADVGQGMGYATAVNHPYAGDYMVDRHGRPARSMHALQLEIDRSCYLDKRLEDTGPELERVQMLVSRMAEALGRELPGAHYAMAAE